MMSKGSFRRALLDVDQQLASVPFAGDVRSIVSARRRVAWRLPALALAVALVMLLVVRMRDHERPLVAGFAIDAPESSWQTRGNEVEVRSTSLELDLPGFGHLVAARGARVEAMAGGVHVVSGRVELDVIHRPRGAAPALVRVSHGTIAVLGTRFTIEQLDDGGRVVLHEGRIRFDAPDRSVVLQAGSSLTWPLTTTTPSAPPPITAAAPAMPSPRTESAPAKHANVAPVESRTPPVTTPPPTTTAPATASVPAPAAALDVDRVITDVANLRARGRFADAAALLEPTLTEPLPPATLERLSYELGDIATYQLADPQRACRHWQSHRARFPQGRYTHEVEAAVRRLACEGTKP
jgi:hypothetical protein